MLSPIRDRLTGDGLAGMPNSARSVLREVGVPRDATLDGWVGPTVFSSDITNGSAGVVAQRWPSLASHDHAHSFVLGCIRERDSGLTHSAFVLEPDTGRLDLVDLDGRASRRVNADVGAFLACLETFVAWWDDLVRKQQMWGAAAPEVAERELRVLAAKLEQADPGSLSDPEAYWPGWIEDLSTL